MQAALYYRHGAKQQVVCELCPHRCTIGEGQTGVCRVRRNVGGKLYTTNYAACTAYAVDPIEKKPLFHFYPGSEIVSIGTKGCNLSCQFCQNWEISQTDPATATLEPADAVAKAQAVGERNIGIAYTYSEPSVWYEYILATAKQAKMQGLKNVLVTNGFINPEPLAALLPYIDALNIDVKAFNEDFYRRFCGGCLTNVKETVELATQHCHVEITTLLITELNDNETEIAQLAQWLGSINSEIPLHLSRYFPNYKMNRPPTPLSTLDKAYLAAKRYLPYVYLGNVADARVNTYCPQCRSIVVDRIHQISHLSADQCCQHCGQAISIVGKVYF